MARDAGKYDYMLSDYNKRGNRTDGFRKQAKAQRPHTAPCLFYRKFPV